MIPMKGLLKKDVLEADGRNPIRYEVLVWNVLRTGSNPNDVLCEQLINEVFLPGSLFAGILLF
jgi:hypothetical protein